MDQEGDGWIDERVMDERPAARLWEGRQRGIGPPGEGRIGVAADGGLKRTRHAGTFTGEKHLHSRRSVARFRLLQPLSATSKHFVLFQKLLFFLPASHTAGKTFWVERELVF